MERIVLLVIVISAALPVLAAQECPDGYKWHDGQCYFLSEGKDNLEEAARDCQRRGAELAVIEDTDTDTYLHTIFKPCPYWISRESEEEFVDELNPADNLFKYVCQATADDDLFCEALGGVCQDESIYCALHYVSHKCGGPENRKCCLNKDAKCENGCGGVCQPNILTCSVDYYAGKCGGGNDRQCCVPADFPCIAFCQGTCQIDTMDCPYPNVYHDRKCGGPPNRRCCAPPLGGAVTTPGPPVTEATTPGPTAGTSPEMTPTVRPPDDDTECEDDCGGICQSDDLYCPIPYYKGKCSQGAEGDRTRLCCVPADEPCVIYCNGVCQKDNIRCEEPNVYHDGKCGGPSNRKCCAPPNLPDDHPNDNPESCGQCKEHNNERKKRAIGAETAEHGDWPWQVQVRSAAGSFCGGSLISKKWVVTAAHCLTRKAKDEEAKGCPVYPPGLIIEADPTKYTVTLGAHSSNDDNSTGQVVERKVKKIVFPQGKDKYVIQTCNNDIALLCLDPPLEEFTDFIQPICLPSRDPPSGKSPHGNESTDGQVWVTGWGLTTCCYANCGGTCRLPNDCPGIDVEIFRPRPDCSCPAPEICCYNLPVPTADPHPLASELQELPAHIVPDRDCNLEAIGGGLFKTVTEKMICVDYFQNFQSDFNGDSGGPLSWKPKDSDCWVLAGLVSWGVYCGDGPSAFTRVTPFTDWITEVTGVKVTGCDAAKND